MKHETPREETEEDVAGSKYFVVVPYTPLLAIWVGKCDVSPQSVIYVMKSKVGGEVSGGGQ